MNEVTQMVIQQGDGEETCVPTLAAGGQGKPLLQGGGIWSRLGQEEEAAVKGWGCSVPHKGTMGQRVLLWE